ncbi:MAG: zinc ribbon domain-containing protein [Candidatus Brocadiaceae bacterium]|nr:zinc ribbon domain-containing protein [Candidatus Brocadiaceae bacterium]
MLENEIGEKNERICPNDNCQFDNHINGANFCVLCGTLLYYRCENCADVNPRYANFCFYCGSSISDMKPFVQNEDD